MMRLGIVGLGKMGILHASILNALSGCSISSITEKETILNRFGKKLLPNVRFYHNVRDMVAQEELEGIYITTPISSHLSIVKEILSAGKKIALFVEKPLAGNYDEAKLIADLSLRREVQSMVGFQKRFSPIFQRARGLLLDGTLGELKSFKSYSYFSGVFSEGKGWRFKSGEGGALLDLGPHLIDILLWYFGEPIDVTGGTRSVYSRQVDDFAEGILEFASGVVGTLDVSWSVAGYRLPEIGIEVRGQNGTLHVTDDYLELEAFSDTPTLKAGKRHFRKPEFSNSVDFLIGDPEYCSEDKYFVECISNHKPSEPSFLAGAKVNAIIETLSGSSSQIGAAKNR